MRQRRWQGVRAAVILIGCLATIVGTALAAQGTNRVRGAAARERTFRSILRSQSKLRAQATAESGGSINSSGADDDLADVQAQWDFERTAPGNFVSGAALVAAHKAAQAMPVRGASWSLVTDKPYDANPSTYTDPFWSNVGSGFSIVGGRTSALVETPDGYWFAGTADGGVWRSSDQGKTWTPVFDQMPTLSIGALAVAPDGSLWVGTGESNVSTDEYAGTGVYRSTDDGNSWTRVGDTATGSNPLASTTVFNLVFDPAGDAYAATDNGLFRMGAGSNTWTAVLQPAGATDNPPYDQQVTNVQVVPGTAGQNVIAAIGWHGPGNQENNGFYQSTDGGVSFQKVTPTGDVNASDIGRTTFAYSADGSKLYAIVQSPAMLAAGDVSNLQGVFVAKGSGGAPASVAGPWKLIADATKLSNSGSANAYGPDSVGAQAWYNQDLAVDPADPNHLYIGLEEVFESTNGGQTWVTASPYWNYGLACGASCPNTTHPDQHSMMIADGKIVIGNDGGIYSRPLTDTQQYGDWTDLNSTMRNMQYYDARAGSLGNGVFDVWGGLQDNGSAIYTAGTSKVDEAAGGDGFYVITDPHNGNDIVGEYTDGTTYSSTDGGHSFNSYTSPTCVGQEEVGESPRPDCDPNARFGTPLVPDQTNANTWLLGGRYVWVTTAGWNTTCTDSSCSWKQVYDTGAANAVTALSSAQSGKIIYAAWVTNGNPGPTFASGIATNYGGTWHQASTAGLPDRFIAGVTVDPTNPAHAYAVFNGYSRRWIPSGGTGHVFETHNGGASWTDISGNLPDIPGDALVLYHGKLALATDQGMFGANEGQGTATRWWRLGGNLPDASVNDVTLGPGGYIYAATHGRGVWRERFGSDRP